MKFNICVIQPVNYIHSEAFTELAELITYGLEDLGHTVLQTKNKTYSNSINIIIGCHLLNKSLISQVPKNSIIINTEQIYNDDAKWNANIYDWINSFTSWDYSDRNILKFNSLGMSHVQHLKIGFHKKLVRIPKANNQDIDVLFYGSIGDRRRLVLDQIKKLGLNVNAVFGVYGEARDQLISRSKIVINIHHFNSKIFEIVRTFYLMTNSKAIVAEVDTQTSIDEMYKNGVYPAAYELLAYKCQYLLTNEKERIKLEEQSFETISKLNQSDFLQPLISNLA